MGTAEELSHLNRIKEQLEVLIVKIKKRKASTEEIVRELNSTLASILSATYKRTVLWKHVMESVVKAIARVQSGEDRVLSLDTLLQHTIKVKIIELLAKN